MFEDYLQDAYEFLSAAETCTKNSATREARRNYRAAVFCTLCAMEAFVNYIGDSFAKGDSIPRHEICFLNDRVLRFSVDEGLFERSEYHRLDEKLKLLIQKFTPTFDLQGQAWNRFVALKATRDSLVHPRLTDDDTDPAEYRKQIRGGLKATIEIMSSLSQGIFSKPLRKQLLDLIPISKTGEKF